MSNGSNHNLKKLQEKLFRQRLEILEKIKKEQNAENNKKLFENIEHKLKTKYSELEKIMKIIDLLNKKYKSTGTKKTKSRRTIKKHNQTRKKVNPEFASLGIPVPPSQQVGAILLPISKKPKTD